MTPDLTAGSTGNGTQPMKTVMGRVLEWTRINEKKPLWLRLPKDCNQSDYAEFYKSTFKAGEDPLAQAHFKVEGNVDFRALLFLPSELPFELTVRTIYHFLSVLPFHHIFLLNVLFDLICFVICRLCSEICFQILRVPCDYT